jgi:hypothetical protein
VKPLLPKLVGWSLIALGCCAVAFGGVQAWLVWGGDQGSWPMQMPTLTRNLELGAEISAAIGVGAIALGFLMRRLKGVSKVGR